MRGNGVAGLMLPPKTALARVRPSLNSWRHGTGMSAVQLPRVVVLGKSKMRAISGSVDVNSAPSIVNDRSSPLCLCL